MRQELPRSRQPRFSQRQGSSLLRGEPRPQPPAISYGLLPCARPSPSPSSESALRASVARRSDSRRGRLLLQRKSRTSLPARSRMSRRRASLSLSAEGVRATLPSPFESTSSRLLVRSPSTAEFLPYNRLRSDPARLRR